MRILFADAFEQSGLDLLSERGHEIDYRPQLQTEDLGDAVVDADVLVVRSTRVDADTFAREGPLGLVIRAGAGTNTIDTAAAAQHGVFVANVPGKNAVAVAELTLGLILALDRRIPDNVHDARAGRWNKKRYSEADGLLGKTIGIVGLGPIGLSVMERAAAFGMKPLVIDKPRSPEVEQRLTAAGATVATDLNMLVANADIVTFHLPADPSTRGIVDRALLDLMRPGTWIINTSRGDIIDEAALIAAIEEKGLRVAIDVFADEPAGGAGDFDSALARHPGVYTTHHIGASTMQAQEAIASEVVAMIIDFERGAVRNVVNLTPPPPIGSILTVRHFDRVGVLSAVLEALKEAGLNVQEMQNKVFAGAGAAVASIQVEGQVPESARAKVAANPDVIHISVRPVSP
ncbi:MAG TPA: NAD(P)-dependent oxidoreductase [Acidimicrobiia bacterium]|nr:NAD(P)-dependent oxidoreductase [Acidimicrobiia bacterium]